VQFSVCALLVVFDWEAFLIGLPGLTLVISPLIALMKDQVDVLRAKGVKASNLDSTLSIEETRAVKDSILDGSLKILYVAPERCAREVYKDWIDIDSLQQTE
jgi:superfamily II DNA helicase RecQ